MSTNIAPGPVELLTHYVRDLSFEHPNAPYSLLTPQNALPSVNVEVSYRQFEADIFETFLTITASAKVEDKAVAIIELTYAGTFRLPAMPAEDREAFLMVDAPRDLFPFARALIGLVTQQAGIPPLLIASPNFRETYRASRQAALAKQLS